MELEAYVQNLGQRARAAARAVARAGTAAKNTALLATADALGTSQAALLAANEKDLAAGRAAGLDAALLDRLTLNPARIASMADGLRQIAALPDPVGAVDDLRMRPTGIRVGRMRVPLGVVGIIYE